MKNVFLKLSQHPQENNSAGATLRFCEHFQNIFFTKHLQVTASTAPKYQNSKAELQHCVKSSELLTKNQSKIKMC